MGPSFPAYTHAKNFFWLLFGTPPKIFQGFAIGDSSKKFFVQVIEKVIQLFGDVLKKTHLLIYIGVNEIEDF
jgi:hypothetical protein